MTDNNDCDCLAGKHDYWNGSVGGLSFNRSTI